MSEDFWTIKLAYKELYAIHSVGKKVNKLDDSTNCKAGLAL